MNGNKYDIDDNFDRLFERAHEHENRMDEIEERLNGTVSLLGINEVAGNRGREEDNHGDDHDQLINDDNENYNMRQFENGEPGQPMGGKRTRSKLRVRSRRKSSIKKGKKSSSSKSSSKKSKKSSSSKSSKK